MRPIFLVLLVFILGVFFWIWRASTSNQAAPPSAGLAAAFRQPHKVVDEKIALNEGQSVSYSFTLRDDARVQVRVNAAPKYVDVMLMTKDEYDKFRRVSGRLFGGQYKWTKPRYCQGVIGPL
jgi:hypothetical protein